MAVTFKALVKHALHKIGYDLSSRPALGCDPFLDMAKLTQSGGRPTVFDVGANVGQTVGSFRKYFARPIIHAFEPGDVTFQALKSNTAGVEDLYLNHIALGSHPERKLFIENSQSDMSSFLEPGRDCWGSVRGRREVDVDTVDSYCSRTSVGQIDILKTDTQGFDYEVLKGARRMFGEHRINLVYLEIIFNQMYRELPRFDDLYRLLSDQGLVLVCIYAMQYQDNRASWTDALFVDPEFHAHSMSRGETCL